MRRQTQQSEAGPVESGTGFRIDPQSLPVRFQADMAGARAAVRATVAMDGERIVIDRTVGGCKPLTIAMPISDFKGVAVRIEPDVTAGAIRAELVLYHADPALRVPLMVADRVDDLAADWQAWGRILCLPLLIVEPDGRISCPAQRLGRLPVDPSQPRRRRSMLGKRRPRILMRRKKGGTVGPVIEGREIIARD